MTEQNYANRLENREQALAQQAGLIAELKLSRAQKALRSLRRNKRALVAAFACFLGIPLGLYAAVPNSFTAGTPAVAADMNANFTQIEKNIVPVGGIIAWHKNLAGTPALLGTEWVQCDGQVLADGASPLNGQTIPNLNGAAAGANSPGLAAKVQMFLRGGNTSGSGQTDAFQGHFHGGAWLPTGSTTAWPVQTSVIAYYLQSGDVAGPTNDGTNGVPRIGLETRPLNMSVVWIMRVK